MKKIILSSIIIACLLTGCNSNNDDELETYNFDVFKVEVDSSVSQDNLDIDFLFDSGDVGENGVISGESNAII